LESLFNTLNLMTLVYGDVLSEAIEMCKNRS
jgi:hypothetical protein